MYDFEPGLSLCQVMFGPNISSHHWQNGHHLADNIFRCILGNDKFPILIKVSLKFVPMGPIDNNTGLV